MKREITIDAVSFSTLIPGMQSGRYDFIAAPTTVTKERAENMLFTAGYLWTAFQFGIKKGTPPIKGWADLKGKSVSVNKGTPYETLSPRRRARSTASPCRSTTPSPTPRRPCSRAAPTPRSAATRPSSTPRRRTRSSSPTSSSRKRAPTGRRRAARTASKLRSQLQDALDCMKKDGTIAKLSEKWFGQQAARRRPRAW